MFLKQDRAIFNGTCGLPETRLKFALLLLFVLVITRMAWLSDDAFVSFRTVWNFTHGYGLTWNTSERVQAYTHPLWLFLVSAAYACTHQMFLTAIWLSIAVTSLAVGFVLYRLSLARALAFIVMLLCSQAVIDYSSSGLENPLSCLLAAIFCLLWLGSTAGQRPVFRLFLVGGLLALNRLDLSLLVAPALAWLLIQQRSGRTFRLAAVGLLPLLLWEIFSLVYYGFLFPNTYYAKLGTGISSRDTLEQGLIYLVDVMTRDPVTLLLVLVALLFAGAASLRRQQGPLALGLAAYLGYVVVAGGDFMQGRFLSVPAFIAAMLLVVGFGEDRNESTEARADFPSLAIMLLMVGLAATRLFNPEGVDPLIRANGVADERRYYFESMSLQRYHRNQNPPLNHPWAVIGRQMRDDPNERVFVFGTIGFAGYAAGPNVHIVDYHALSDPFLARLPSQVPWRIGHFARTIPPGYLESLRSGENRLQDPKLAALYQQIALITRGPIFSQERFAAIIRMNLHGPDASPPPINPPQSPHEDPA